MNQIINQSNSYTTYNHETYLRPVP